MSSAAFTIKSNKGLCDSIKTDCGISLPYDPKNGGTPPDVSTFTCLWDTGATGSVISGAAAKKLGLIPTGNCTAYHADGSSIVNTYLVNLYLPNHVAFSCVKVSEGILNGFDILIGMDIITKGDLSVSNYNGVTCMSFRIPSVRCTDYVVESDNVPLVKRKLPDRNDPCPCGSGKKFKNCCQK